MPEAEESDLKETLDFVLRVAIRRRRWIFLPACVGTLATIAYLSNLPDRYTSEATLLVVGQQVPQRFVPPNITSGVMDVLQGIKQQVLSRTRLLKISNDFNLYGGANSTVPPEQIVKYMQGDISIEPVGGGPAQSDYQAFKISFVANSPTLARDVTQTLTSLFIGENVKTREEHSASTTNFLNSQLAAKKQALDLQEQRLREFKVRYIGELPEQQQGNLSLLNSLNAQLQNTVGAVDRVEQQEVYLNSMLSMSQRAAADASVPDAGVLTPLETAQAELRRLQSTRAALLSRYTPQHPDVLALDRQIAEARQAVNRLDTASSSTKTAPKTPDDPSIVQIKSQLEANRVEKQNLLEEQKRLKASIAQYQARLNQTPLREQEMSSISNQTELLRQEYADLQKKAQESQLATDLAKSEGGQQFRLIDSPSLPVTPSGPKRRKMSVAGAALSLLFGLALAVIVEMRDSSFHAEEELLRKMKPPFVVSIPVLLTSSDKRRLALLRCLEGVVGCLCVSGVAAAGYYMLHK